VVTFDEALGDAAVGQTERLAALLGLGGEGGQVESVRSIGSGRFATFRTDAIITPAAVGSVLRLADGVLGIEPDRVYRPDLVPNDPQFTDQWQLENIGQLAGGVPGTPDADIDATLAWDTTIGTQDVIMAVIDTGVDMDHPDLFENIWTNPGEIAGNGIDDDNNGFIDDVHGWDFGELDNDPDDAAGHGSAVAGTIAAVGNNGVGVTGVAWNVSILPIKIAGRFGDLTLSAIVGAHEYLTMMIGQGHNIVGSNNSYGAFAPTFWEDQVDGFIAEKTAIQDFISAGGIFVAAAGNNGADNDSTFTAFPASYDVPGIISVAATDNNDALASFSNYGAEKVDLGAPGVSIWTTAMGGGYGSFSGTSAASPMVAGAVALLKSANPDASAIEVRQALMDGADRVAGLQNKTVSGGRLNIAESLRIIGLAGPVVTAVSPGPATGAFSEIIVGFNKDLDATVVDVSGATLTRSGGDGTFSDGNETTIALSGLSLSGSVVTITPADVPVNEPDTYRLVLDSSVFVDLDGNRLNGDSVSGSDEVYDFELLPVSGSFEVNDTLADATPVVFGGSGSATFTGVTLGDGLQGALDVDLFRFEMSRGGLITARIDAQHLPSPSPLDSYVRLFNALGEEISFNDQFNGNDSFLDFFVSTGGVYYIGVSGFGNDAYDPTLAGSGESQSTGVYNLTVTVDLVQDADASFADDDLPAEGVAIPDQQTITRSIDVADTRQILDVNVRLDAQHTFVGDLRVSLISPVGTEVVLIDGRGGDGQDLTGTLFDDEASVSVADGVAPFTGGHRPDSPLSAFDGQDANGTWTLVVSDTTGLHSGTLLGWSIELRLLNDIFGAFELNDTLTTARVLDEINPTGSATRGADIGDGGFGLLDVDLYQFTVEAGSTLDARVTAGAGGQGDPLDSAVRLFDGQGAEIKFASPAGTNDSAIEHFVFAEGGTYTLGVSASSNLSYDPTVVASGAESTTAGPYTLTVSVTPGVSDGPRVLDATSLVAGVGVTGALGTGGASGAGLQFNATGSAGGLVDLLVDRASPSAPESFFGLTASGLSFRNDAGGGTLPVSIVDESDASNRRVVVTGQFNGVSVERALSFAEGGDFIAIDVRLTNTSGAQLRDVAWMEGFNPIYGLNLVGETGGGSRSTFNDVDGNQARAWYKTNTFFDGLTVSLAAASAETRASASIIDPMTIRDPLQLLVAPNDPDGAFADQILTLSYDLGDLDAGAEASMRYFVLMGASPTDVDSLYAQINDGTGTGHLAADPANPADETLDDGSTAPTLPYRLYYPEGFANNRASTFIPIVNPHDEATRVVVIARYENPATGFRDQVLADTTIAANSRGGITITDPAMFAAGTTLVRTGEPYAVEIRSELPVGAMFSHFDFGVATGESFTSITNTTWTFGEGFKASGVHDFIVFYNPTDQTIKVNTTIYGSGGPTTLTSVIGPYRRGGWNIAAQPQVADGPFGIKVDAPVPIVAALTHFDTNFGGGFGVLGMTGDGSTSGVTPEGQFGVNSDAEFVTVLNTNDAPAQVLFTFLFENGSAYRQTLTAPALSRSGLTIGDLPGFDLVQQGQGYAIAYEVTNDLPVAVTLPTFAFGEAQGTSFTATAYSLWAFADGFRPPTGNTNVTEFLRLYNPGAADTLVEITLSYTDGGSETFQRTVNSRVGVEFNVHDFVLGVRRDELSFYGITVKAATPVVAYLGRSDAFFPGAFGALGTPLGATSPVTPLNA
jgi:subtilisin family serine protease/subtilisin-like proprotein convertase family protein